MKTDEKPTIKIFDKDIEYDPTKVYGIYNAQGQFGALPVEKTLPKLASAGGKEEFLPFLDSQVVALKQQLEYGSVLDKLVDENVLEVTGAHGDYINDQRRKAEIQNTIDLFEYVAKTLRS